MAAFDVFLNGKQIDTVFWNNRADGGAVITADDVKKSLIDHDGYDPRIEVKGPFKEYWRGAR